MPTKKKKLSSTILTNKKYIINKLLNSYCSKVKKLIKKTYYHYLASFLAQEPNLRVLKGIEQFLQDGPVGRQICSFGKWYLCLRWKRTRDPRTHLSYEESLRLNQN